MKFLQGTFESDENGIENLRAAGRKAKEARAREERERGLPPGTLDYRGESAAEIRPFLIPKEVSLAELPVLEKKLDELEQQIPKAAPVHQKELADAFEDASEKAFRHRINANLSMRPVIERVVRLRRALGEEVEMPPVRVR